MPTRTFTVTDLSGYSISQSLGAYGPSVSDNNFGNVNFLGSHFSGGTIVSLVNSSNYNQVGTINYLLFPVIPDGALISRYRIKIPFTATGFFRTTGTGTPSVSVNVSIFSPYPFDISTAALIYNSGVNPTNLSESLDAYSDYYDFAVPLTKEEFETLFATVTLRTVISLVMQGNSSIEFDYSISLNGGWLFEVTYDVPAISIWYKSELIDDVYYFVEAVEIPTGDDPPIDEFFYTLIGPIEDFEEEVWYLWYYDGVYIESPLNPGDPDYPVPDTPPWEQVGIVAQSLGSLDMGGTSEVIFQGDPSGIYTLVPGKRNDTLYDSESSEDTTDVAIPNPFIKTGFIS